MMNQPNETQDKEFQELMKDVQAVSAYTGVTMKEAYECYMKCNKDVVKAIIELEEGDYHSPIYEKVMVHSEELFEFLKNLIAKGNVSRIVIRRDENVLLTIPVTMGAIGIVMFPYVSVITLLALMFGQYEVIIEKNKVRSADQKVEPVGVKKIRLATVDRV